MATLIGDQVRSVLALLAIEGWWCEGQRWTPLAGRQQLAEHQSVFHVVQQHQLADNQIWPTKSAQMAADPQRSS